MATSFFPDRYKVDIRAQARDFYQLFYQVELADPQLDRRLEGAQ